MLKRLGLMLSIFCTLSTQTWADKDAAFAAAKRGDYGTALKELRPIADQGDPAAQVFIGLMYSDGLGVEQSHAEALKWYRKAGEQGSDAGQFMLGHAYLEGLGVAQDYAGAMVWFQKAADQRNIGAYLALGAAFAKGLGVAQDYVQAYKWLSLAATQSKKPDKAIRYRNEMGSLMTPEQIAEAQHLAREWKPR